MNWPSMLPWCCCLLAAKGPLELLITSVVWGLVLSLFVDVVEGR